MDFEKIKFVKDESQLDDEVFINLYRIMSKNKVRLDLTIIVKGDLVFLLNDPERLLTVSKNNDNYTLKMEGEDDFEYSANVNEVGSLIHKLVKRQAI